MHSPERHVRALFKEISRRRKTKLPDLHPIHLGVALAPLLLHNDKETQQPGGNGYMALKVGDIAPDFELPAVEGEQRTKIKLSDFRGKKNVLVTFHPLNWTPT